MTNHKIITPLVAKVMKTMKEDEKSTAVISPECVQEVDPELTFLQT